MSSSTNRPGIAEVKWLADSQTLAFLGAPHDSPSQVYILNVRTHRLVQKTHHLTSVDHFDISGDGKEVLFSAESQALSASLTAQQRREGVVIQNQSLEDLLGRRFNNDSGTESVFLQANNELEIRMPPTHLVNKNSRLSLSPDGHFALSTLIFEAFARSGLTTTIMCLKSQRHDRQEWATIQSYTNYFSLIAEADGSARS